MSEKPSQNIETILQTMSDLAGVLIDHRRAINSGEEDTSTHGRADALVENLLEDSAFVEEHMEKFATDLKQIKQILEDLVWEKNSGLAIYFLKFLEPLYTDKYSSAISIPGRPLFHITRKDRLRSDFRGMHTTLNSAHIFLLPEHMREISRIPNEDFKGYARWILDYQERLQEFLERMQPLVEKAETSLGVKEELEPAILTPIDDHLNIDDSSGSDVGIEIPERTATELIGLSDLRKAKANPEGAATEFFGVDAIRKRIVGTGAIKATDDLSRASEEVRRSINLLEDQLRNAIKLRQYPNTRMLVEAVRIIQLEINEGLFDPKFESERLLHIVGYLETLLEIHGENDNRLKGLTAMMEILTEDLTPLVPGERKHDASQTQFMSHKDAGPRLEEAQQEITKAIAMIEEDFRAAADILQKNRNYIVPQQAKEIQESFDRAVKAFGGMIPSHSGNYHAMEILSSIINDDLSSETIPTPEKPVHRNAIQIRSQSTLQVWLDWLFRSFRRKS